MLQRTIEKFKNNKVIELYTESGYSLNQLEAIVGSSKKDIRLFLLSNGVKIRGSQKDFTPRYNILSGNKSGKRFNDKVFEKIDNEEKAYWLGFFYADGYVLANDYISGIALQARDVSHLHKFDRFVNSTENNVRYKPKITKEKVFDLYQWVMKNENFYNSLIDKGCIPNKSLILTFPNKEILPESLIKHFIRGYFDGDGSVCFTEKTKCISILGTFEMLNSIKNITNLFDNTIPLKPKGKNIYQISLFNKKAFSFLQYIYKDSKIYLDRKHEKYLEFCRLYEESYKLLGGKNEEVIDDNLVLTDKDFE